MVHDLLSESSLKDRGLYDSRYVAQLIEKNDAGIEDNAHILWTLLTHELWHRTFFSNVSVEAQEPPTAFNSFASQSQVRA
jgi:hypothetical protein